MYCCCCSWSSLQLNLALPSAMTGMLGVAGLLFIMGEGAASKVVSFWEQHLSWTVRALPLLCTPAIAMLPALLEGLASELGGLLGSCGFVRVLWDFLGLVRVLWSLFGLVRVLWGFWGFAKVFRGLSGFCGVFGGLSGSCGFFLGLFGFLWGCGTMWRVRALPLLCTPAFAMLPALLEGLASEWEEHSGFCGFFGGLIGFCGKWYFLKVAGSFIVVHTRCCYAACTAGRANQ